jgi:hypothetical protein
MRYDMPFSRKTIISTIAFASLTSLTLVQATAPALAREMNHCSLRYSYCAERCIMRNNDESKISPCLQRTCNHQFNNCMKESSTREGGRGGGRTGGRTGSTRNLVANPANGGVLGGGGVLDGGLVPAGQSPAATGTPITRSHSAPNTPVIIR